MKILLLTPRIPYPLRDGGAIAMNQMLEGLLDAGASVTLLAMNTARHWVEPETLPSVYNRLQQMETVYINNSINPFSAFLNLFTDKSYNISRFINKDFAQQLRKMLQAQEYDLILFESIYTSPYLWIAREHSNALCACRVHNIEHQIWQHLCDNEQSFLKKKYLRLLTSRLKNYEIDILKKFDLLLPISVKEVPFLEELKAGSIWHVPFGVDATPLQTDIDQDPNTCYHIGSMDWAPNVEGIEWFLNEVWDHIKASFPEVTFYVAGKNMPARILSKRSPQTEVVGEVDDFIAFSLSKNILIVPLRSGAGIRVKILEAMALGKPIVATSMAMEGIPAQHDKDVLIANTPDEFKQALIRCFQDTGFAQQLGSNARDFVLLNFDKQQVYSALYEQLQKHQRVE
ncbi:MAG: glycosyltransferase [Chitinophagaceae bacterium]|nr:glycosyltransferase [Chitinophagaceae bacterium]